MEEQEGINIHVLELSAYQQPEIIEDGREAWVEYGANNDHYDFLIGRYKGSTTNNSAINKVAQLAYGKGLEALDASKKPSDYAVMKTLFRPSMLRASFLNEYMLGSGVLQVFYDKSHTKVLKVEHVKTRLVRPEKCDEDGNINGYYFSNRWDDTRKYPPTRFSRFGTSKDAVEFLVYGKDSIDLKYFSEVDYLACIPYAVLEEEIADYQINDIQNGFAPTMIVNFNNGVPTEQQQRAITKKVSNTLTGANGKKVLTAFNSNAENKTTLEPVALNDAPEHYTYLSTEAQSKILNGHCVISPFLVGIKPEGSGFSSSADEIEVATQTFYNQTIRPHQELLLDALDSILAFNGISLKLYFKNLNLLDIQKGEEAKQEEALSYKFSNWLDAFGEDESEEWELVDSRNVDYDLELDLDTQFANWGASTLQKIKLATGIASPNKPSTQDREIDGFHFKVRYKYVGSPSPERGFCKDMMRASKVYRKEDIIRMGKMGINKAQAHNDELMNIWLYKGGVACEHKWERRTYVSATKTASIGSAKTNQISTGKARKFGYRPTNEKEVSVKPHDMPNYGHHPDYNK
jgi:hypothetical protein